MARTFLTRGLLTIVAGLAASAVVARAASAATWQRSVTCTGSAGEAFTERTVTGLITSANELKHVRVIVTGTGVVESVRQGLATQTGPSWLHGGYVAWDVTGGST